MEKVLKALKEYFIPQEDNDHKPHVLRGRTVAFVVMVALVAEAVFVFGATYLAPTSRLFGIITSNALIDETNQSRVTNSVPSLQESSVLDAAAQEKANDMASKGYFAHTSPTGVTPWYWFANVGYSFTYAGENLAVNFTDSQDVTTAWMNSPEHRENILDNNFTQIGMATAQGVYEGRSAIFVVELFGAPAASPFAFLNTAAAASVPGDASSTAPAPTPAPVAAPVSAPKPVAKSIAKAAPAVPEIPGVQTVVPTTPTSGNDTSTEPSFVAVKGAETQAVAQASTQTPAAAAPANAVPTQAVAPAPQSNLLQRIFSDPKKLANDFYLFLAYLFMLALVLNVFIKIRIQHPKLIFSGLLVIIVAGLCVLLNQNIALLHAAVL